MAHPLPENGAADVVPDFARLATSAWLVCSAVFIAFVCLYARFGGPIVARAGESVGEVVARQANQLYAADRYDEAFATYRRALAVPYDDPKQRSWSLMRFGRMLLEREHLDEAERILDECVTGYPDSRVFRMLCDVRHRLGRPAEAAETAARWYTYATQRNETENRILAKYNQGQALEEAGQVDAALAAYIEGHDVNGSNRNTYHAAVLLEKRGDIDRAHTLLATFLDHNPNDPRSRDARRRLGIS